MFIHRKFSILIFVIFAVMACTQSTALSQIVATRTAVIAISTLEPIEKAGITPTISFKNDTPVPTETQTFPLATPSIQTTTGTLTEPKDIPNSKSEALEFSLKVIKSYIENDTTAFQTYLSDALYSLERWDKPIPASSISVTEIFSKFDYSSYTMDDFYNNYSYKVLEYDEYKDLMGETSGEYGRPDSEDYLFFATVVEDGENFMWEDLLVFLVTKRSGDWKIRAM